MSRGSLDWDYLEKKSFSSSIIHYNNLFKSNATNPSESDMATDGSPLGVNFHLEVVAYQPTFYDIGNTCSDSEAGMEVQATLQVTINLSLSKSSTSIQVL